MFRSMSYKDKKAEVVNSLPDGVVDINIKKNKQLLKESIEVNRNEVLLVKVVCNDRLGLLKNLNDPS